MKRYHLAAVASLSWLALLVAGPAHAQVQSQVQKPWSPITPYSSRPTFSPYLNLLRGGDPTLNYQGLVRPQQEFRQNIQTLGQQTQLTQQAVTNVQNESDLPVTGHQTQFLNLGGYFLSRGGRGSSAGVTAAPAPAGPVRAPTSLQSPTRRY
jgi:hypothetical protein